MIPVRVPGVRLTNDASRCPCRYLKFQGARKMIKQSEIVDDARSTAVKRYAVPIRRLVQVELDIDISERRAQQRQLVEEPAFIIARLYRGLLARPLVDVL